VTIHAEDPFATPEDQRSPVRRFRGRLPSPVALWTAASAGLTVSSTVIADGEPGKVLGLLDEESELWEAVSATGRFTVTPLEPGDRQLADKFAGLLPAPGGVFSGYRWQPTDWGPVLEGRGTWVGCTLDEARPLGWALLVQGTLEQVAIEGDRSPLVHYRGRYRELR
jgi:3-hydroxy-9,10-secoandrosta-1,3,5(10)-triene-9,17-dione monooxygenase reductase component